MIDRREQPLRFVLPDDLRDPVADFTNVGGRRGSSVNAQARTPAIGHLARDGSLLAAVELESVGSKARA